jgi:hypothetical protein
MPKLWLATSLALGALLGCAREAPPRSAAESRLSSGWVTPASYAFPPRVVPAAELGSRTLVSPPAPPPQRAKTAAGGSAALPPAPVAELYPGGEACLARLGETGIRFASAEPKKGVATPVVIQGPIAGIEFWSHGRGAMITDCRLALALRDVAAELRELGVTKVRFSGAYVYRMSRVGRLSLHAHGLALDVHEVEAQGRSFDVRRDYARGLADGCEASAPLLNRMACRLRQRRVFKELLTPDDNADHHDHLHLAIAPEP